MCAWTTFVFSFYIYHNRFFVSIAVYCWLLFLWPPSIAAKNCVTFIFYTGTYIKTFKHFDFISQIKIFAIFTSKPRSLTPFCSFFYSALTFLPRYWQRWSKICYCSTSVCVFHYLQSLLLHWNLNHKIIKIVINFYR